MANLKPQSPLKYMDDYIYPLTSADQVIVDEKGTRLDSIMSGMIYSEEIISNGGPIAIDADSVCGETPQSIYNNLYPVGSVYTTSTAVNPGTLLGFGTWKLVGKEFRDASEFNSDNTFFIPDATNTTSADVCCIRSGASMTIRLHIHNKVAINTAELVMGKFNWEAMGVTQLPFDLFYLLGGSVDGDDAFLYRVYKDGNVHVWKYISSSIAKDKDCYSVFSATIPHENMLDSACDKFYWERTK